MSSVLLNQIFSISSTFRSYDSCLSKVSRLPLSMSFFGSGFRYGLLKLWSRKSFGA